jgi:hypothetical protein
VSPSELLDPIGAIPSGLGHALEEWSPSELAIYCSTAPRQLSRRRAPDAGEETGM